MSLLHLPWIKHCFHILPKLEPLLSDSLTLATPCTLLWLSQLHMQDLEIKFSLMIWQVLDLIITCFCPIHPLPVSPNLSSWPFGSFSPVMWIMFCNPAAPFPTDFIKMHVMQQHYSSTLVYIELLKVAGRTKCLHKASGCVPCSYDHNLFLTIVLFKLTPAVIQFVCICLTFTWNKYSLTFSYDFGLYKLLKECSSLVAKLHYVHQLLANSVFLLFGAEKVVCNGF